jgi:hypothetical protein
MRKNDLLYRIKKKHFERVCVGERQREREKEREIERERERERERNNVHNIMNTQW